MNKHSGTDISATPHALAPRYYNDLDIHARLREELFFKTWQFACHQSQLSQAGSYYCVSIFDQDIFVARTQEGDIKAFYNVCQHRGHTLLQGMGRTKLITCPYHAWSYDLEGRLRAAPGVQAMPAFDKSAICLTPVQVDLFAGFVFVNLDPDAAPMRETFAGVEDRLRELCPDIDQRKFAHQHDTCEYCNWIVAVENYNECYHCKVVHPDFAAGIIDTKSLNIRPFAPDVRCLIHHAKAQSGAGAWYDTSGSDYAAFFLWPAFALQVYPGGLINTYHWQPLAVDDTRVFRGWYSPNGEVDETLQKVIDLDYRTTFCEDLALVKQIQRGLGSRGYVPGPLVVNDEEGIDSEHSIAALHGWLKEVVG